MSEQDGEDWDGPALRISGSVRFHEQVQHLLVDIESVTRHPDNPREGDVDAIIESIEVNGFIAPVIAQKSTGHIIAGNHRYDALQALGSSVIPVIQIDVDDEMAKRYLLADNRTSDLGRYNEENLLTMLLSMQDTDLGLIGTGYTEDALNLLLIEDVQAQETARFGGGTMTLLLVWSTEKYEKVLAGLRAYEKEHGLGSESEAVAHMLGVR
jgi:ParB-like nuclease family protein